MSGKCTNKARHLIMETIAWSLEVLSHSISPKDSKCQLSGLVDFLYFRVRTKGDTEPRSGNISFNGYEGRATTGLAICKSRSPHLWTVYCRFGCFPDGPRIHHQMLWAAKLLVCNQWLATLKLTIFLQCSGAFLHKPEETTQGN